MEQRSSVFDLGSIRDLLAIIFKHKYKITIAFLVIFTVVTVFAFLIPRAYEAKSVLLVKFGREFMSRPDVGSAGSGFAVPPETIMRGEISILTSGDIIRRVISSVSPEVLYPGAPKSLPPGITSLDMAAKDFQKDLKVGNIPGSSLIEISFVHQDPFLAAKVVNLLVDYFTEKHLDVFSGNSTSFLESQQKAFEDRLKESEGNLATFKQKHRVFSFEEQRTGLLAQRIALDTSLKAAQSQISEVEQKIAFVKSSRWTTDVPPETRAQLATLQQRERELLEKYTEGSRNILNVRQEMQAARDSIRKNTEETRQIELGKAEGELSIVKARADSLRRQLGQVDGEVHSLDARGRELADLKRETTQQEQNYQTYARKLEESLIMDDMDRRKMVAVSIVEKATPSMMPKETKLSRKAIVVIGFFGGIAAGIALAFLLEFLSPGMTTPLSAEQRLGIPVMVAVSKKE